MGLADAAASRPLIQEAPDAAGTLDNGGLQAYWRKPDGWIVISGMGPHSVQANLEQDFTLLKNYGKFVLQAGKGCWQPNDDPYLLILQMGGIKEFTVEQIMAHQWHIKPHPVLAEQIANFKRLGHSEREALDLVIPQMQGVEFEVYKCHLCPQRTFTQAHHLDKHAILHKAERTQAAMGETIAKALAEAQAGNMAALAPMLQSIAQSQEALTMLVAKLMGDREAAADEPPARKGKS